MSIFYGQYAIKLLYKRMSTSEWKISTKRYFLLIVPSLSLQKKMPEMAKKIVATRWYIIFRLLLETTVTGEIIKHLCSYFVKMQ